MATTHTSAHEAPTNSGAKQSDEHKPASKAARRAPTDDEILGISPEPANAATSEAARSNSGASARRGTESATRFGEAEAEGARTEPENFRTFDEDPELREAWQDAAAYREAFATPAEAREATELLADLNRMVVMRYLHSVPRLEQILLLGIGQRRISPGSVPNGESAEHHFMKGECRRLLNSKCASQCSQKPAWRRRCFSFRLRAAVSHRDSPS